MDEFVTSDKIIPKNNFETKDEIRRKSKELRNLIDINIITKNSDIIQEKVLNHSWFEQSKTVFVYVSTGSEVRTSNIIRMALKKGKNVCVPRVIPGIKMEAVPISNIEKDLQLGFYNIMEPKPCLLPIKEEKIDLVIVPGLAFDRRGFRLGYGGGYYDKYLPLLSSTCKTIGVAFHSQIFEALPVDEHDKAVMMVITDREIIAYFGT